MCWRESRCNGHLRPQLDVGIDQDDAADAILPKVRSRIIPYCDEADLARDPLLIWAGTMTDARRCESAESATWFFNEATFFRHAHYPYL